MDRKRISASEAATILDLPRTTFQRRLEEGVVKPINPPNPLKKRQTLEFWLDEIEALRDSAAGNGGE